MQTLESLFFLVKTAVRFNNPLVSKSTLQQLVYCPVFWHEVQRLQEQCISMSMLVFYYYLHFHYPVTRKNFNTNVQMFFQIIFSKKI